VRISAERTEVCVFPGALVACKRCSPNSHPDKLTFVSLSPVCVTYQRTSACRIMPAVFARPRSRKRCIVRTRPSAVNSVICVSSEMRAGAARAYANEIGRDAPNFSRIIRQERSNSMGYPRASPSAPPSRQPVNFEASTAPASSGGRSTPAVPRSRSQASCAARTRSCAAVSSAPTRDARTTPRALATAEPCASKHAAATRPERPSPPRQ
jgi:hypothetical protein